MLEMGEPIFISGGELRSMIYCAKSPRSPPTSDRRAPFLDCAALYWFDYLANAWRRFWSWGVAVHNTKQKRRHPFEKQRTTRGGAVQIRAHSKVGGMPRTFLTVSALVGFGRAASVHCRLDMNGPPTRWWDSGENVQTQEGHVHTWPSVPVLLGRDAPSRRDYRAS